jgi:glycosyltransferase involved in cell wall biosynthesis
MKPTSNSKKTIVSVIIPCYNHGYYLPKAIESVLNQTYQNFEIIVIDDGSTDDTKEACLMYPSAKYFYQVNAGLSAARNSGVKYSSGDYLVFLDADDWLLETALESNLDLLIKKNEIAFVSGGHELYYEPEDKTWLVQKEVDKETYLKLLEGNFIGMHATVLYQRWVFDTFKFDTSLPYCEDYDLYLQITRQHPVIHHTGLIAVYRLHDNNMSSNYSRMMKYALLVLSNQEKNLITSAEKESFLIGIAFWKSYYSKKIYDHLCAQLYSTLYNFNKEEIECLKTNSPMLYEKFNTKKNQFPKDRIVLMAKNAVKNKLIHTKIFESIKKLYKKQIVDSPTIGKINLGDIDRTTPFSTQFGYDRGGPLDRYYIENFLNENSFHIKGGALEIGDNEYTLKYGGDKHIKSDILHIDDTNEKATYVGDLSNAPHLPSESFDCIILTQTLQFIYDYKGAIETCFRVLKPGGTLLLTVPGISHIAQDQWSKYWLWSFTDAALQRIMQEHFSEDNITIKTYGNVLVASAFLYGMGLPELKKEQLDYHDPHYQVIITVKAIK